MSAPLPEDLLMRAESAIAQSKKAAVRCSELKGGANPPLRGGGILATVTKRVQRFR